MLFVFINCLGVKTAAAVELVVTIVAIIGLILFAGAGITHVNINNIAGGDVFKGGFKGIFGAIPYAIWFYLAVEGGAMAAEECKNPKKDIPKGFILGIVTLVVLALLTFFVTAATLDPRALSKTDSPLPAALEAVYGAGNFLSKFMSFIGLFGLIASLHGIIIGYSRQAFAMSRAGYLPGFLSKVDKNGTPISAIIFPSLVGLIFVLTGATSTIIVISSFGAVALYIISMSSLFILRKKQPELNRPYKVYYPLVPAIALITAVILLIAMAVSNAATITWVIGAFGVAICYYFIYTKITSNAFAKRQLALKNYENADEVV
jgi:ethanolamine permease